MNEKARIVVRAADGSETDVTEAVGVAFDALSASADFGSGFMGTDEVAAMRVLQRAAGYDELRYAHDKCAKCGMDREDHYHPLYGAPGQCSRDDFELAEPTVTQEDLDREANG